MMTRNTNPLELDAGAMRSMVEQAMDRIVAHIESLPDQPASAIEGGGELARSLAESLPETGSPFTELLELLFDRVVPCSFNTAAPSYMAYIPSGGLFHSAVADLIADSVNRYVGVWLAAPGLAQLETNVVRWLCEMVGYPHTAGGILTSGGSLANFTAVVTARQERLPEDFLRGTLYVSEQVHHSILKAATLAGFPARNTRPVAVDGSFRLRLDELERQLAADRRDGYQPFLVVASAGTTNTGSVDDLEALADLAEQHQLWLHTDAAYGGFFALTERGRDVMQGLHRADSITLDPHKGLFLPYGNGSLLVRDPETLRRTHSIQADYMPSMQADDDRVDFCEISPELSRDFRGLRTWLPIKMHGIGVFRSNLDEKLDLARWAAAELVKIPDIELVADPQLSLVVFRLVPDGVPAPELDQLNQSLLENINRRQHVFLTGTALRDLPKGGAFVLRICVLSFRTHRSHVEACIADVRLAVQELVREPAAMAVGDVR